MTQQWQRPVPGYPRFPRLAGGRGPSVFRLVYLGTHPVALVLALFVSCAVIGVRLVIAAIVICAWLLHCGVVAVRRAAAGRA